VPEDKTTLSRQRFLRHIGLKIRAMPVNVFHASATFGMMVGMAVSLAAGNVAHAFDFAETISRSTRSPGLLRQVMLGGTDIAQDPLGTSAGYVVMVDARPWRFSWDFKQCLGVAVTRDVVLTAGHCLHGMGYVRVRFVRKTNPLVFERIEARSFAIHPDGPTGEPYAPKPPRNLDGYRDIAVILLKKPSKVAAPITAVHMDFDPTAVPGVPTFYTFGTRRDQWLEIKEDIHFLTFDKVSRRDSAPYWFDARTMDGTAICVGDSGAPVVVSVTDDHAPDRTVRYLAGILTFSGGDRMVPNLGPHHFSSLIEKWGMNIPVCGNVLTFIDIPHHVDWINEKLKEMSPANPRVIPVLDGQGMGRGTHVPAE